MSTMSSRVVFNNGNSVPVLGLGTWKSAPGQVYEAVKTAISMGYRHLDCAPVYGNEKEIGEAIKTQIQEGVVERKDIFVTSKLWCTMHNPALVEPALKNTLEDLCIDYLDLYLIHWPFGFKEGDELFPILPSGQFHGNDVDYIDTWTAMENLVQKGLVKNIGLSNFNSHQINRILNNCKIKPVNNQIECHPYLTQSKLSDFCKSKGIVITAYSPLGSPDRPWAKPEDAQLLNDPRLRSIADNYGKTTAQVVLRYQVDRGHIVIPKTVSEARMMENKGIMNFTLSNDDIELINSFNCNGRICSMTGASELEHYPFNTEF
ncbi:aldo-keto reductase family 1 member B1 [Diachasma alloeum]|uniref:aldo-keto reductase family 1 member B1 n=1 Tax=Diachasma alloeum TaxID=454923 RepID=UPI0007383EA4|nr:aldo-keto reductase family 1 member B1 [Diachasma alloeum]